MAQSQLCNRKSQRFLCTTASPRKFPSTGLNTVLTYRLIDLSLQFCEADTFIYFTDEETKRHTKQTACSKWPALNPVALKTFCRVFLPLHFIHHVGWLFASKSSSIPRVSESKDLFVLSPVSVCLRSPKPIGFRSVVLTRQRPSTVTSQITNFLISLGDLEGK